jgi:tRNA-dihydrouridine synthase
VVKEQGAGLVFTEMVSAPGLCQRGLRTMKLMDTTPENGLWRCSFSEPVPTGWPKPRAWRKQPGRRIDLNMGCR